MEIEGWLLLLGGAVGVAFSLFSLVGVIQHLYQYPPERRSNFIFGYGGMFFLFGLPCWALVAIGLTRLGAPHVLTFSITLVLNAVVQPFFAYAWVTTFLQLLRELFGGRAYYGGQVIPREDHSPAEYAQIWRHCLFRDLVGVCILAALSWACLSPWL